MFGKKQNRIADLEARLVVARRDRQPAVDTAIDTALRSDLATAKATLRAKDTRINLLQQQVDQLIARLGEYADQGITNGQRADRYRAAWQSARRRAEAYGEGILRLVDDRDQYHEWFDQEQAATAALRSRLAKSEQGRRNLKELLAHHRDMGSLGALQQTEGRLRRVVRACARYRAELAAAGAES